MGFLEALGVREVKRIIGRVTVWDGISLALAGRGIVNAVGAGDLVDLSAGVVELVIGIGGLVVPRRERLAPAARTILATVKVAASASHSLTQSRSYTAPVQVKASCSAVLTRADGTVLRRGDS